MQYPDYKSAVAGIQAVSFPDSTLESQKSLLTRPISGVLDGHAVAGYDMFPGEIHPQTSLRMCLALNGWQPFAQRSGAKGWFANASAIPFGCAEKAATLEEAKHVLSYACG